MQQRSVDSLGSLRGKGTGEPGGLLSMGSHRVGHDWSGLATAAAAVWLGLAISGKLWIGNKSGPSSHQWAQQSLICTAFGLSPRQGIVTAPFLRVTEETPVKPNPVSRAEILCMCEIKAGGKINSDKWYLYKLACGAGWERESPGALLTQLQSEGQVRDGSWEGLLSVGPYSGCGHQDPQSLFIYLF